MNKLFIVFLMLISLQIFAQTDHNGNPVFNSVSTGEETINDFQLLSNYYTLKNNIENKGSSVYISVKPTLNEIENAAINLPSDFFVIAKDQNAMHMVLIANKPTCQYLVVNPSSGKQDVYPCSIFGDISENRANEIVYEKYDSKAKVEGNKLFFNNKEFSIISNKEIKGKILELITKQKLNIGDSTLKILSKTELKEIVLKESRENGKLDFFTEIKGREMDGIQIKPGVFSTNMGVALYKWGRANVELGTSTVEDALEFWAEYKGRQPNQREKDYIKLGFNKELEK